MKNSKGFTLIELMIVVAILAILSVVAVPAFIKYMRKAKTSEAITMLSNVYKGAAQYYSTPHTAQGTGLKLECQFPNNTDTAFTPVEANCCADGTNDSDKDDRCDVTPSNWDTAVWSALNFQMTDQAYYSYRFIDNGLTLGAALFTATAVGDLDCDTVQSTFERYGYGDAAATHGDCSMRSDPAIYSVNETE